MIDKQVLRDLEKIAANPNVKIIAPPGIEDRFRKIFSPPTPGIKNEPVNYSPDFFRFSVYSGLSPDTATYLKQIKK